MGTVGEIVTLSFEDKVGSQERRGGYVNFGKEGEVFSRAGRGPVENSFCNPCEPDYLIVTGLAIQRSQQKNFHCYPWRRPDSRARGQAEDVIASLDGWEDNSLNFCECR